MSISKIFKALGISKWGAAWTILTRGMSGLLALVAEAFTNLLRKANKDKLAYYADLATRIAKVIRCAIEQFVTAPAYKAAGDSTVGALESFAKHVSDGEYTQDELMEDIDFMEACIDLWKEAAKCEKEKEKPLLS